jgi:aminoglycoside phosphotransferase (APT) family kinase protein
MTPAERARLLADFGIGESALIGEGLESRVYALSDDLVLRLARGRTSEAPDQRRLKVFLDGIAGHVPFATPRIVELGPKGLWRVEERLPGGSLLERLRRVSDDRRDEALRHYLAAGETLGAVHFDHLPYGHILARHPVTAPDWHAFLRETLAQFVSRNRVTIAHEVGDPYRLAEMAADMLVALPTHPPKALVHGDYFPGNVLVGPDLKVTALLDFGLYTLVGDPVLDLAVAYQTLELIAETTAQDARFVRDEIVASHGEAIVPSLRFYRAWLAFSMADPANGKPPYPRMFRWAVTMLRLLGEGRLPV